MTFESKVKKGLKIGTKAPAFDIIDTENRRINLYNILKDANGVILEFYRGAYWDPCRKQLIETFQEHLGEFKQRNIKILALAPDNSVKLKQVAAEDKYGFPIIPDTKGKIAKNFKVYDSRSMFIIDTKMAIPSTIVINKDGINTWKSVGDKYNRATFEMILDAIDKI